MAPRVKTIHRPHTKAPLCICYPGQRITCWPTIHSGLAESQGVAHTASPLFTEPFPKWSRFEWQQNVVGRFRKAWALLPGLSPACVIQAKARTFSEPLDGVRVHTDCNLGQVLSFQSGSSVKCRYRKLLSQGCSVEEISHTGIVLSTGPGCHQYHCCGC